MIDGLKSASLGLICTISLWLGDIGFLEVASSDSVCIGPLSFFFGNYTRLMESVMLLS